MYFITILKNIISPQIIMWVKEPGNKKECILWFHLYKILKNADSPIILDQ